ncbi:YdcF family protein [Maritalea mobilis]|uniref:YdcF family protein n=1 Tax=Maritalea mobilis TaxID=483324 RepID=UPI001C962852|nr:YdcF family protein [Maritalea mobilis]MBY6201993.1 YdcF family protein [Maritalea mobilis]
MSANPPATRPDEAILVLGAAVWPGGVPSPTLARRTEWAARQWHDGRGQVVIPCGGLGKHGPPEAEVMRDTLIAAGVPPDVIRLEDESHRTGENIRFAKPLLDGLGLRKVLIVSDAYHLPRATLLARRAGLIAEGSAPPLGTARLWPQLKGALREIPAYLIALAGLRT